MTADSRTRSPVTARHAIPPPSSGPLPSTAAIAAVPAASKAGRNASPNKASAKGAAAAAAAALRHVASLSAAAAAAASTSPRQRRMPPPPPPPPTTETSSWPQLAASQPRTTPTSNGAGSATSNSSTALVSDANAPDVDASSNFWIGVVEWMRQDAPRWTEYVESVRRQRELQREHRKQERRSALRGKVRFCCSRQPHPQLLAPQRCSRMPLAKVR
jgi:hypothetical protein